EDAGAVRGQQGAGHGDGREGRGMRFAVEAWAPEYGSAMGSDQEMAASDAAVDHDVEMPLDEWQPRPPPEDTAPAGSVIFTDGVRRVDAQVWITTGDGASRPGICASYAAGAVRCDGRAGLVSGRVG